jgi:two-component system, OmpR family, sensor histidine kinase KdpD
VFVVVAIAVSAVVDLAARRTREAARARAEAETLSTMAGSVVRGREPLQALLGQLREAFGLTGVSLLERDLDAGPAADSRQDPAAWRVVARVGVAACAVPAEGDAEVPVGDTLSLVLRGRTLAAADRRVVEAFAAQAAVALRQQRLAEEAAAARPLAEAGRVRTALLAAVSHDLRTPLAAAKAAVTSLGTDEITWTAEEHDELVATAEESLDRLDRLVANLLDMSRLQAGALGMFPQPLALEEAVPRALDDLGDQAGAVAVRIPADLPDVLVDPGLLERVLVNVLANALRYSPAGRPPVITASALADIVELRVIDHGPGIDEGDRDRVFLPFQRLGDQDNSTGVGLGLALSRGLAEAMSGELTPEHTPGGGLTMVLRLPTPADAGRDRGRPGSLRGA